MSAHDEKVLTRTAWRGLAVDTPNSQLARHELDRMLDSAEPMTTMQIDEDRVAIIDLADELQVRKQRLFKVVKRLSIRPTQRREASRGNQNVATVTMNEAAAIRSELSRTSDSGDDSVVQPPGFGSGPYCTDDIGVFYLIQLEPDHDPGRFKIGFTTELEGRLRKHRCSAPFAQCLKSWPCRRTWERAGIDCTTNGCEQLHTEVFRTSSLTEVSARADAFFSVMPKLATASEEEREDASESEAG